MSSLAPPRLVMLDLDGTLVDSAPDLVYSLNESLRQMGLQQSDGDEVRKWVGNGAEAMLRRALADRMDGEPDPELVRRGLDIFLSVYSSNLANRSRLFPGVADCLEQLRQRDIDLVCITNKHSAFTEPLLQQLGIDHSFSMILSGDSLPRRKPDPDQLLHAMLLRGVPAGESWMVGDSVNDVLAARAAGVAALCVDYGYTPVAATDLGADVVLSKLDDMLGLM